MSSPSRPKVTVVGAGPTGLTLACVLARAGVGVRVLDQAEGPARESSRATTIHAGSLEALDALDGLGGEIAAHGVWARRSRVWAGRREVASLHWHRMPTRYAALVNLRQQAIEAIIRSRLAGLGVEVEWGRTVTDVASLDASHVIGCDGARSTVRRAIGAELEGETHEERFLLADVEFDTDLEADATHLFVSTAGVLAMMPVPDGHRINGTLRAGEVLDASSLPEVMAARLGAAHDRVRLRGVTWCGDYRTHSRLASRYRRDRVLIAGDAAHLNSPVGGQGMNVGIGDALDLGRRLVAIHRGDAGPDVLDGYEGARRPVAAEVIRTTRLATRMLTARGRGERFVRNRVLAVGHRLPPVQRRLTTGAAFVAHGRSRPVAYDAALPSLDG